MNCSKVICPNCVDEKICIKCMDEDDEEFWMCINCRSTFENKPCSCGGELVKKWKDGKEVVCICQKCGYPYDKGSLDREKFLEIFSGM